MKTDGYLLEFRPMGPVTKIIATDVKSGVEVAFLGSAKASRSELTNLALQKLKDSVERGRAAVEAED
ncbi:MAG: serine hydroxymethyltransferase [Proteobacteria bacterium]|nr:serine hydroxymethyltransferase [Pseudomonadota bacterium]